jgi:hypothetical protein
MRYDLADATSKRSSERAGSSSVRGGACDAASGCGVAADGAERDRPGKSDIENGTMDGVVFILVVLMRQRMVGLSKVDEMNVEFAAQFIN